MGGSLQVGFVLLVVAAAALGLSSCSTTAGLGHDIQQVGNKIENAAEHAAMAAELQHLIKVQATHEEVRRQRKAVRAMARMA